MKAKKIMQIVQIVIQTFIATLSLSILLSVLRNKLNTMLLVIPARFNYLIVTGDIVSQILLFGMLSMPLVFVAYLVLRTLHSFNKLSNSFYPYTLTSGLIILCVITILSIPKIMVPYINISIDLVEIVSYRLYYLAIVYFTILVFFKNRKKY